MTTYNAPSDSLFAQPHTLSRRTDPATSKQAATHVVESGQRKREQAQALMLVRQHPGKTARELDAINGTPEGNVRKRLPELERLGLVRRGEQRTCTVSPRGLAAVTWYPGEVGQ